MDAETGQEKRTRSVGAAIGLSLLSPGLGQIYCGKLPKGIVLLGATLASGSLGLFAFLPVGSLLRTAAVLACVVFLGLWGYAIADAARTARSIGSGYALRDYNRWYVYADLALLSLPLGIVLAVAVRTGILEAFRVPSVSMAPSVRPGDLVLVNKLAYREGPVRRGDVVVFRNPDRRHQYQIKRVVALPGDELEIRDNELIVGGERLERTRDGSPVAGDRADLSGEVLWERNGEARYRILLEPANASGERKGSNIPKLTVPHGHCFVLGDNRNRSEDSREYGPVTLASLAGRVDRVLYPRQESLLPGGGPDDGNP